MGCGSGNNIQIGTPPDEGGRKVFCVKFQREMTGLNEPPLDNELGQRIYENVSKEAWKLWFEHWKMVMNEYRINLGTPEGQQFYLDQLDKFFFGEGSAFPPGYVPPKSKA